MKKITMFYQRHCPFCKKAFSYIDELKAEHQELAPIEIETIEETENAELADKYDYYYVPTFYIDGKKEHEGGIFKEEVEVLLRKALESK
jgi:glutaredoxin